LESLGYIFIYLFNHGQMGWNHETQIEVLREKKKNCFQLQGIRVPECVKQYIVYCRNLLFDETPNYEYVLSLFPEKIN